MRMPWLLDTLPSVFRAWCLACGKAMSGRQSQLFLMKLGILCRDKDSRQLVGCHGDPRRSDLEYAIGGVGGLSSVAAVATSEIQQVKRRRDLFEKF